MNPSSKLAALIERYFTVRLMRQRSLSANTIASYRDTFRLLFTFAQARLRKPPSTLALDDLDAPFVSVFPAWYRQDALDQGAVSRLLERYEPQEGVNAARRKLRLDAGASRRLEISSITTSARCISDAARDRSDSRRPRSLDMARKS